jgi:hypothetical protein
MMEVFAYRLDLTRTMGQLSRVQLSDLCDLIFKIKKVLWREKPSTRVLKRLAKKKKLLGSVETHFTSLLG